MIDSIRHSISQVSNLSLTNQQKVALLTVVQAVAIGIITASALAAMPFLVTAAFPVSVPLLIVGGFVVGAITGGALAATVNSVALKTFKSQKQQSETSETPPSAFVSGVKDEIETYFKDKPFKSPITINFAERFEGRSITDQSISKEIDESLNKDLRRDFEVYINNVRFRSAESFEEKVKKMELVSEENEMSVENNLKLSSFQTFLLDLNIKALKMEELDVSKRTLNQLYNDTENTLFPQTFQGFSPAVFHDTNERKTTIFYGINVVEIPSETNGQNFVPRGNLIIYAEVKWKSGPLEVNCKLAKLEDMANLNYFLNEKSGK